MRRYIVTLTEEEERELKALIQKDEKGIGFSIPKFC